MIRQLMALGAVCVVLLGCKGQENGTTQPLASNTNEIARIQANPNMPDDVKQAAIARLQAAKESGKVIGDTSKK